VIGGDDADPGIGLFDAIVLGIVEGLTEFLPVSSTGHLILARSLLGLPDGHGSNTFVVGIQMGAITAIAVLYRHALLAAARTVLRPRAHGPNLLWQIAVAALPAVVLGFVADDWIDAHLFGNRVVIATMLIGGVLLLVLERWLARRDGTRTGGRAAASAAASGPAAAPGLGLAQLGYAGALAIGCMQCLALVPGTSRSAATIAGGLLVGLSRPAAAEFSFLVGLPILYGASLYRLAKDPAALQGDALAPFVVGTVVSFASALAVVGPFVRFLRTHTFAPFAWYRIAAGTLLAAACAAGWLRA
jgi:undecaprenyl-diphosphatase